MAEEIAVHENPAWRAKADFIIFAELSQWGLDGMWEQLWARRIADDEYEVCCIPFFTYGIALGDRVLTRPTKGRKYVVSGVSNGGGHRILRFWLKDAQPEGLTALRGMIVGTSLLHEWSSPNLLAIDVPSGEVSCALSEFLNTCSSSWNIAHEWAGQKDGCE